MKNITLFIAFSATVLLLSNCKKEAVEPETEIPVENLQDAVLSSFSANVAQSTYNDLADQSNQLYIAIQKFKTTSTDDNLNECRVLWKNARSAWEQSEGFLFGPVSTNNIDPRIDTWPVNYVDLDSVLNSQAVFTEAYIEGLEDALRGFHPIEYLIFGQNGTKSATQVTARQKEYLLALAENLKKLTSDISASWNPALTDNYHTAFVNAGGGSKIYLTKRAAYEELVNAMAGICEEVANGKLEEPFVKQDSTLEESPFSKNSITDFTNNIISVQNVYYGKYKVDGAGLEDIVRETYLSLDKNMKLKLNGAISSLNKITVPFGRAIFEQPQQIKDAQKSINELKDFIENDLMTFIQTQIK
jgi:predicted lipoprotein